MRNSPTQSRDREPDAPPYITADVRRITGYGDKTLYRLLKLGLVHPIIKSSGVFHWSQADLDAVLAYRKKNRSRRLLALTSDRAVFSGR